MCNTIQTNKAIIITHNAPTAETIKKHPNHPRRIALHKHSNKIRLNASLQAFLHHHHHQWAQRDAFDKHVQHHSNKQGDSNHPHAPQFNNQITRKPGMHSLNATRGTLATNALRCANIQLKSTHSNDTPSTKTHHNTVQPLPIFDNNVARRHIHAASLFRHQLHFLLCQTFAHSQVGKHVDQELA